MKKVLIVDDDPENVEIVSDILRGSFEPVGVSSGREAILMAVQKQPDVILLDINMPGMDGFEVVRKLRDQPSTRSIPVIMLTSSTGLDHRCKGLDLGADDYITKPFQGRELISRVQARVRRKELDSKEESVQEMGNLKLCPRSNQVWINNEPARLTQMEFDLLRYFMERPNQVIPRNKLLGDLWPDAVVADRTVDTHIANLRRKLKKFDCSLSTIYGAGYILKTTGVEQ